jgi:hypothetical protein
MDFESYLTVLSQRKQTRNFDKNNFPTKSNIDKLINETFKITPSKQNLYPYKLHILGPEHVIYKQKFMEISSSENIHGCDPAPPYMIIFTLRIAQPNSFVKRKVLKNPKDFQQCDPKKYANGGQQIRTAIEIGLFAMNFTNLCKLNNIDTAYLTCFPFWKSADSVDEKYKAEIKKIWKPLPFIKDPPLLVLQAGYFKNDTNVIKREPSMEENYPPIKNLYSWVNE